MVKKDKAFWKLKFFGILKKLLTGLIFIHLSAFAQKENRFIRSGNNNFFGGNFKEAEIDYLRGLEKSSESVKAHYNLGGALYKQENFDDAVSLFTNIASKDLDPITRADAFYNLGNSYLKSQRLNEAIESYKNTLRMNPSDEDARYNLEYARRLQQEQEDQQDQQQDDQQDQNDQQDQQQEQNDQQDQQEEQDQQNKQDQQHDQEQQQQQQPQQQEISKQDAERMLEALKQDESKILERIRQQQTTKPGTVERDW